MENFEDYQSKYPLLFKQEPRCGFHLPSGWSKLVHSLCAVLEHQIKYLPEADRGNYFCEQVKEKFGGLRFYMSAETEKMRGAIALAEYQSFGICERCGSPGKERPYDWIRVLCDECDSKRKK